MKYGLIADGNRYFIDQSQSSQSLSQLAPETPNKLDQYDKKSDWPLLRMLKTHGITCFLDVE